MKSNGKEAFCDCSCLTPVEIPHAVTNIGSEAAPVTTIESEAFCGCRFLTLVEIPDSVTIGCKAFNGGGFSPHGSPAAREF